MDEVGDSADAVGVVTVADIDRAPVNLPQQLGPIDHAKYEELVNKFTEVSIENFTLRTQIDDLNKRINTSSILDALIQPYASKAFWFMCAYCLFVGAVLILSGFPWCGFSLPKEVLSLMVGSTAVTVIGLVGMVLTGIFVGARKGGS